jgi:hypothetical protein
MTEVEKFAYARADKEGLNGTVRIDAIEDFLAGAAWQRERDMELVKKFQRIWDGTEWREQLMEQIRTHDDVAEKESK